MRDGATHLFCLSLIDFDRFLQMFLKDVEILFLLPLPSAATEISDSAVPPTRSLALPCASRRVTTLDLARKAVCFKAATMPSLESFLAEAPSDDSLPDMMHV